MKAHSPTQPSPALAEFGAMAFDAIHKLQREARALREEIERQRLYIEALEALLGENRP